MRVLVLHSRYLSGPVSGENRVVEDETALLRERGHEVHAWTPSPVELGNLEAGVRTVWSTEATRRVRSLLGRIRADVVHVHNLFPMLSPAVLRKAAAEAAVVMTLHNYRYSCLPGTFLLDGRVCEDCLGKVAWRGVTRGCFRGSRAASAVLASSYVLHKSIGSFDRVDRFLAVSDFMRAKHIEAGVPADRIFVQRNFAAPAPRREGTGRYFLYIGRLAPEKGLSFLVDAWRATDAHLLVVGEGPEETRLRAAAPPNVEFRGSVSGGEVPGLLRHARGLVVPSQWFEGTPRSVIEAFAAGVPVLASRIGSLAEVVDDGSTGYLLPPDDGTRWIEAVTRLRDDGENRRLGEGAYAAWEHGYRPEHAIEGLESSYRAAITAHAARRSGP